VIMSSENVGPADAEAVIAEALKAFWVMVGFLAIIWLVQIVNWADDYRLSLDYGIHARDLGDVTGLVTAPFLHLSWAHIEGNSGPLFIFGFLAAFRGVKRFLGLTALIVVVSGVGAWLTAGPHVMALCFAYQFSVLLPHKGISWQGHLFGFVAGIAGGWIFRERRVRSGERGNTRPLPAPTGAAAQTPTPGSRADLLKELDDLGL
jgi:membrane associated rhomboid family serine protease